jgi:DNA modification methylase
MCLASGSLWVFGGYSDNFAYLNDLYRFDFGILSKLIYLNSIMKKLSFDMMEKSKWEKKSAKGTGRARHSHSMVAYNGALYPKIYSLLLLPFIFTEEILYPIITLNLNSTNYINYNYYSGS